MCNQGDTKWSARDFSLQGVTRRENESVAASIAKGNARTFMNFWLEIHINENFGKAIWQHLL